MSELFFITGGVVNVFVVSTFMSDGSSGRSAGPGRSLTSPSLYQKSTIRCRLAILSSSTMLRSQLGRL